jgi:hypothetical protein
MKSAKLAEVAPKIAACLDGSWEREYLDSLPGDHGTSK